MVINSKTFVVLHKLTDIGKERYEKFLEDKATEILFKHAHPIKYFFRKIKEIFEWD